MLPTDEQIEILHRECAKTEADFNIVWGHCQIVGAIALQLLDAGAIGVDREFVRVGSLLHDIGAYGVMVEGRFEQGVRHGVIGEEILSKRNFPPDICRIASHHTGVGLTAQDVKDQRLPIPPADYTAKTLEEELIMYADKFHSKGSPPNQPPYFCTFGLYRKILAQFGSTKVEKFDGFAASFGKPDLVLLSREFGHEIKDM